MDPAAIMNDASFPPNTAPFHLPEIWQLPPPPLADSEEEESAKGVSTTNNNGGANVNANGVSDGGDGKRMKGSVNRNESGKGETEASSGKPAEQQTTQPPPEYIHVRARRGQATDSHILAERATREKISERMKILQDLVPGCNKVTGKALMLDEIINYVLSLQRQVEFLQMKLVAENSRLIPGIEVFPPKDEKKRCCRFFKWLDVADANYDLSTEMEQGRLSELKIKVDKDFAGVDKDFAGVNKEIRCLKLGIGLIGFVMLFVFLLVCVLK